MAELDLYEIPEQIKKIEWKNEISELKVFQKLKCATNTLHTYISLYKAMIYMEEAAASKRLLEFDLKDIKLVPFSQKDRTFQIIEHVSILYITVLPIKTLVKTSFFLFISSTF